MGRENKNEAVAALHRERILNAAESLFSEKGFERTTIEDISKASGYSRRTIYAYYESKDDILYRIIAKGLVSLRDGIKAAVMSDEGFVSCYKRICAEMVRYHKECPHSFENVNRAKNTDIAAKELYPAVKEILALGTEINGLLADFIKMGRERGEVRSGVVPEMTVYVLWSGISSLISLAETKGEFIAKQLGISVNKFLEYGFEQLIDSILEERI